jgi:2-polyprenyl-3-methyl-5-hydroxy-6-metoxy-1,4-benzoquinol methylase
MRHHSLFRSGMDTPIGPVRRQYEALPFPHRDPEDEARRIVATGLDHLGKVSHFCFGGRLDRSRPIRILVAGGGTGDATIFLAEQLRDNAGATILHLDLSHASIEVAKRRAARRGLANIDWRHGSILDLDPGRDGLFDYINCAGVLHHMPDPAAGLRSLRGVLAEEGGMGLMLYGRYGRSSLYEVQDLMRILRIADAPYEQQVRHARSALASLSPLHSHVRGWPNGTPTGKQDDANIFDAYLHPQDVAYTVPELYSLVEQTGLGIVAFGDFDSSMPVLRIEYDPATYITDAELLAAVRRLSPREQQAAAEVMNGTLSLHSVYVTARTGTCASFGALDNIPYFPDSRSLDLARSLVSSPSVSLELRCRKIVNLVPAAEMRKFLLQVDGQRTTGQITQAIAAQGDCGPAGTLLSRLRPEYERLNSVNMLLLRDRATPPFCFVTQLPQP